MYLLDTSVCIPYLRTGENKERFTALERNQIVLCSIVTAELRYGLEKMPSASKMNERNKIDIFTGLFHSLPFDEKSSKFYGEIRAFLESKGITIGGNDLMIAAIAKAHNLIVLTRDEHFGHVPTLKVEKW